jgi:hypothetical protein
MNNILLWLKGRRVLGMEYEINNISLWLKGTRVLGVE